MQYVVLQQVLQKIINWRTNYEADNREKVEEYNFRMKHQAVTTDRKITELVQVKIYDDPHLFMQRCIIVAEGSRADDPLKTLRVC